MSDFKTTPEDFAVLIARAGLPLTRAQTEAAQRSYEHVRELADLLRVPRSRHVEGAVHFTPTRVTAQK